MEDVAGCAWGADIGGIEFPYECCEYDCGGYEYVAGCSG